MVNIQKVMTWIFPVLYFKPYKKPGYLHYYNQKPCGHINTKTYFNITKWKTEISTKHLKYELILISFHYSIKLT